ncbi:hypothetical protein [Sulfolobus acidocaldarius]|uniref:hypothetical protein n=1 Tax=Sulfolobus acidocaldarius TaxID=2285 RepID=UPI001E55A33D|nr:hypothetical protein [Sulfolobus acidocaldarius]
MYTQRNLMNGQLSYIETYNIYAYNSDEIIIINYPFNSFLYVIREFPYEFLVFSFSLIFTGLVLYFDSGVRRGISEVFKGKFTFSRILWLIIIGGNLIDAVVSSIAWINFDASEYNVFLQPYDNINGYSVGIMMLFTIKILSILVIYVITTLAGRICVKCKNAILAWTSGVVIFLASYILYSLTTYLIYFRIL